MTTPSSRLAMIALGIRADQPLDPEQPPLVDGMHLRWSPAQDLGFPWHGFYLFRRETRPRRRCLKKELTDKPPVSGKNLRHTTAIGTLSRSLPLLFTDDFPESGSVETDLGAPLRFELPEGVETDRFDLRIGFRETPRIVRTCVDFRRLPLGNAPTPRTEEGAVFTVRPVNVVTQAPDAAIEQWSGSPAGLEFTSPVAVTYHLDIALPCRAAKVDLLLTNREALTVSAFEAGGAAAGVRRFDPGVLKASTVTMTGKAIDHLTIESTSVDSALLHEICWECLVTGGTTTTQGPEVRVDFTTHAPMEFPNPIVDHGVTFEARDQPGKPGPLAWFRGVGGVGKMGLWIRPQVEIRLPCATSRAELLVFGVDEVPLEIRAFNQDGVLMDHAVFPKTGEATAVLNGEGITRIRLDALMGDALLHTLTFRCNASSQQQITVTGYSHDFAVASTVVKGDAGQIVSQSLDGPAMTAVTFSSGNAALVDLCYVPKRQTDTFGWEQVPGFQYPLPLPAAHHDYPCPNKPATADAARTLALSRVTYPAPASREEGFWDLHEQLVRLVRNGPAGGAMVDRTIPQLPGHPESASTQEAPSIPYVKPLDLVFLASLHPAYAQMLGLYFVDRDVPPGVAYDYLILGDPTGVLGGSAKSALDWLAHAPDWTKVDFDLLLDRTVEPRTPIAPPQGARAYALPGAAARQIDGSLPEVAGNVGLWWPLPPETEDEEPDRIIFYDLRRMFFGATRPAAAPAATQYQHSPRLQWVLVSEPDPPPVPNPRSSDWPPSSIAVHVVDGNLAEGWWGYRLAGQDLFGRRCVPGPPAEWYQWDPPADTPLPWYWKTPAGHRSIDSFAVGLLDKVPPPTPLGVEAWALDPDDRWLFNDTDYRTWRNSVSPQLIGLRVRWRWTYLQQLQAPDTREFRIYQQPGRWNAILANIEQMSAASATESNVLLDIADGHPADAFKDARLRIGNDDFAILGSTPGAQLQLRVKNIGAHDEVRPQEKEPCSISIPAGHNLHVDTSKQASWLRRLAFANYDPPLRIVLDPSKDANGKQLTSAVFNTAPLAINGVQVVLPSPADLSGIQPWIDHVWLKDANQVEEARRIVRYDAALRMVTLESPTTLVPGVWAIGRPAREYEVFLPAPDTGLHQPFEPSPAEPVVYAQIAVSAADDKTHSTDPWPGQPLGNRSGNESALSPSATVYRVLNAKPDEPELPDLPDRLWATPADWADRSYSSFRFRAMPEMRVHILRTLDETLFQRDWLIRETRKKLDPVLDPADSEAKVEHLPFFPDWPADPARRAAAAALIDALATGAAYSTLSADAWELLALLPGNEGHPDHQDLETRDRFMRHLRGTLARTDPGAAKYFPTSWNDATRDAAVAELNGITSLDDYSQLSDNALRLLPNLPGNEAAFTQVTLEPIEMNAPSLLDNRRPDDAATYVSSFNDIRAYTDTLPGRATNRYLYRAQFVDRAQNVGALSVAGPPVYLRKVEPPRAPVITAVTGGDGQITIQWTANGEEGALKYRVYRANRPEDAIDVRRMAMAHEFSVNEKPEQRELQLSWTDSPLPGGSRFHYRIAVVDVAGNMSVSSSTVAAVVDIRPPSPPVWSDPVWLLLGDAGQEEPLPQNMVVPANSRIALKLEWRSLASGGRVTVTRKARYELSWRSVATLVNADATSYVLYDDTADPRRAHTYRIFAISSSGIESLQANAVEVGRLLR